MRESPTPDFLEILRILTTHKVDFLVVGGVCAVLHGAPLSTFDLDVVHSRKPDNVARLLAALEALDARYRFPTGQRLKPGASHLSSPGHQLLRTRLGLLDLLGVVGANRPYEELVASSVEVEAGEGVRIRILDLAALIRIKEETAGEKDRAVLPLLRWTLLEKLAARRPPPEPQPE